jgi:Na+/phosphate symporter
VGWSLLALCAGLLLSFGAFVLYLSQQPESLSIGQAYFGAGLLVACAGLLKIARKQGEKLQALLRTNLKSYESKFHD